MIVQRLFSRKLKDSRTGVGWLQEKLGKNEAEKYFKIGQEAANESYEKGEDEETVVKKSGKKARNRLILDKSGKPILQGTLAAGTGYLLSKSPGVIESISKARGLNLQIPPSVKNLASKHAGKIAAGAGLIAAGRHIPRIYDQQKAVRTGVEINSRDRIKKTKKEKW